MLRFRSLVLAVLGTVALVGTGRADFIRSFAYTDRGVYTGTFTRYTTLNDAQTNTNAVGVPRPLSPTDLSVFFARDIVSAGLSRPSSYGKPEMVAPGREPVSGLPDPRRPGADRRWKVWIWHIVRHQR